MPKKRKKMNLKKVSGKNLDRLFPKESYERMFIYALVFALCFYLLYCLNGIAATLFGGLFGGLLLLKVIAIFFK